MKVFGCSQHHKIHSHRQLAQSLLGQDGIGTSHRQVQQPNCAWWELQQAPTHIQKATILRNPPCCLDTSINGHHNLANTVCLYYIIWVKDYLNIYLILLNIKIVSFIYLNKTCKCFPIIIIVINETFQFNHLISICIQRHLTKFLCNFTFGIQ